ncbi:MAG: HDOD domain-containing protein [Sandaracinaceae bacterium]
MQRAVTEDPSEAAWFGREDVTEQRRRAIESPEALIASSQGLRAPPALAAKILGLSHDPHATFVDLRIALEQDPALSAQLVRTANSVAFATRYPCASLDDAVMRLGRDRVRAVAAGLVAMGAFERETAETMKVRRHSAAVAAIAETLGREYRRANAADLFLLGMVHDIGKLVFAESGSLDHGEAPGPILDHPGRSHAWEEQQVGFDHAALGAAVLEAWGFPESITHAVELHHDPGDAYSEGREIASTVAILRLADEVEYAIWIAEPEAWTRIAHGGECSYLGITEAVLAAAWPKLVAAAEEPG